MSEYRSELSLDWPLLTLCEYRKWKKELKKYMELNEEILQANALRNQEVKTEEDYNKRLEKILVEHVVEQQKQVDHHKEKLAQMLSQRRRLQQVEEEEEEDDQEDERGARFMRAQRRAKNKPTGELHTFDGVQGWLTDQGVESLELFLPTEMSASFISALRSTTNLLHSPQLDHYYEVMGKDTGKSSEEVKLIPRIVGSPIIVDLEGDGHNELVVAVNYAPDMTKNSPGKSRMYLVTAIVAFDLMIHQIKWISHLELSASLENFHAFISSAPTIIDLDGDGELNIIVGTGMGQIHVLDNYGIPLTGFPIAGMNQILAPVAVEDLDQDGALDIIAIDVISTMAVYSSKGVMQWNVQLTGGCTTAPAIADIDADGVLDVVVTCASGGVHVV